MKALTLWPEWAWAICNLDKRVENRTWVPNQKYIGKQIAIHAGKKIGGGKIKQVDSLIGMVEMAQVAGWECDVDDKVLRFSKGGRMVDFHPWKIATSSIVSVATITDFVHDEGLPWGAQGQWHWLLEDVMVLDEPFRCAGSQRLWQVPWSFEFERRSI
jgi:hypothetical protein